MISLKRIKSLTIFYWREKKLFNNYIWNAPGFTYSACGPCTKHHERIKKFRKTENLKHLYRSDVDKACFAYDCNIFW